MRPSSEGLMTVATCASDAYMSSRAVTGGWSAPRRAGHNSYSASGRAVVGPARASGSYDAGRSRASRYASPRRRDGELMGPQAVWLRLLQLVELWIREHLGRSCRSLRLLRDCFAPAAAAQSWAGQD